MKNVIFKGVGTALITPFNKSGIDFVCLEKMVERQIESKVDAIIVLGTTGEPATIEFEEREKIIDFVVRIVNKRVKVVVGCGANSTAKAISFYKQAQRLGADGALIVSPYYNKCTQNGLYLHYKEISESGNLPIIIYNVPSRTGVNILPETAVKICKLENVVGIKEASGNISQIVKLFNLCGDKVAIYSGEDSLNAVFMSLGASGYISVASNVIPKLVKKTYNLAKEKEFEKMNKLQGKLLLLIDNLFSEVNPIPIKATMWYIGYCENILRMPLTKMSKDNFEKLKKEINKVMVLENDCL